VLTGFGSYSTQGNGQLSEYLPWYRKWPARIRDTIILNEWIHSETGGHPRSFTQNLHWFKEVSPKFLIGPFVSSKNYKISLIQSLDCYMVKEP